MTLELLTFRNKILPDQQIHDMVPPPYMHTVQTENLTEDTATNHREEQKQRVISRRRLNAANMPDILVILDQYIMAIYVKTVHIKSRWGTFT